MFKRKKKSFYTHHNKYNDRLKSSYDDVISAAVDFFYQWDPSIATPIEEECRQPGIY